MSSSQDSITTVSLMNGSNKSAQLLNKDLLYRLDGLFAFYHRQWWCHRQMFYRFKWCHGCLNALALIMVAAGIVVGSVLENNLLIACLTAAGTVIKGWNDFKIDMCRFAYTTYDKTLIELRTYVRGLPMEEFADQINAVSEMVLNLLRNRIPVHPITMAKLHRYKTTLREVGKRRNSVKRRREHLREQKGIGFW